jgi:hypothetical protein
MGYWKLMIRKKYMKKYISVLFLVAFIIPLVTFASWWNPLSWFNSWTFNKKEVTPQVQIEKQKTSEEKIIELQKQLDELKSEQTTSSSSELIPEVKKDVPIVDNSAKIKAETQAKLNAELKLKAEQEALIIKMREEAQAKIDAELKLKAEQDAVIAKQRIEEQAKIDEQNEARLEAEREKEAKLNAINLKIANLNAKYAKDVPYTKSNFGGTTSGLNDELNRLWFNYENDYNALMAEYQIIKYSN